MNNGLTIRVGAPLLRPGLTIETTTSARYARAATEEVMMIVRDINDATNVAATEEEDEDGT